MIKNNINPLKDSFGRMHNYLRISLTEKCNLRCTYCMPEEGVLLTPKADLMTAQEVIDIAKIFVENGVNKIRLTGGEPFLRKDIPKIIEGLSELPVSLSLTTNGVLVDKYIDLLEKAELKSINFSLDTLSKQKFMSITKRDQFNEAMENLTQLVNRSFNIKINVVLIKGFNDDEIFDFIEFTKENKVQIRFIEFMPFKGNKWDLSKLVSYKEILKVVQNSYDNKFRSLQLEPNYTARNFQIENYKGTFGIISTVTNPFCDACNRIRLTANGKIKNCLFSMDETNLLEHYRNGEDILPYIQKAMKNKKAKRAGLFSDEDFTNVSLHDNRSMITIGG